MGAICCSATSLTTASCAGTNARGSTAAFRAPSNNANGLARDRQGRLLACEHLTRRVTRTEYDGAITVLAERFEGKRLNSPNDIVCARDGSIWFTDPLFGIAGYYEGLPAPSETPWAVYRIDPESGKLQKMIDDIAAPNGLAFTPDESGLYVVESRAEPHRRIWLYDHAADGRLSNKRLYVDAQGPGAYDGIAVDAAGNVWCGFGSQRRARCRCRGPGRGARLRPCRQGHRPHPPARALRQSLLRRREQQPTVHGGEPFAVCAVRQRPGGGLG